MSRIDKPDHYTQGKLECIEAIIEALGVDGAIDYCRGCAFKYLWRARYKKSPGKDMAKAAWYCNKAAELFGYVENAPTSVEPEKSWEPEPVQRPFWLLNNEKPETD